MPISLQEYQLLVPRVILNVLGHHFDRLDGDISTFTTSGLFKSNFIDTLKKISM